MIGFLKKFLDGDRTPEEKALLAEKAQRDVMRLDQFSMAEDEESAEDDEMSCDLPKQGCGGCGCRS